MWYNFIVKRFLIALTSLICAVTAYGGVTALAEENETLYPEDGDFIKYFTFDALTDYAVGGEAYAFAEKNKVFVFDNGDRTEYLFENGITALDYADGVFYCADGEKVYSLPDKAQSEHVMAEPSDFADAGKYNYKLIGKTLKVADWSGDEVFTVEGEYSNLKKFDGKVYVQSENFVYALDGSTAKKLDLYYADYSATSEIYVGDSADRLKNYSAVTFVNIKKDAFMTSVDLTSLDEEYFDADKTVKVKEETCALLLAYSGNSAIVAIGDESYILLKSATAETSVNCFTEAEFDTATVTGNRIYASPYVIIGTSAVSNASGTIVTITRKLSAEGVLGSAFYEVQYRSADGSIRTGFVADGFLTEYIIEDNKPPEEVEDPDYSEAGNTKTVLIVLAVVILVLAAVGYLAYLGTADKNKKSKEKKEEKAEQKE